MTHERTPQPRSDPFRLEVAVLCCQQQRQGARFLDPILRVLPGLLWDPAPTQDETGSRSRLLRQIF